MSNELRKQLKATPVSAIKKQEKEVNSIKYNEKEKDTFLKVEQGSNKIRIFPAHKESTTFYYPYSKWWLNREITYEKEGEEITEIKKRPVWNAKLHGNSKKDVVEEYINFVKSVLKEEIQDAKELELAYEKLTHWQTGLSCKHDYICYANKYNGTTKEFGLFTFSNAIKNRINDLAITDDDTDSVISTDPFTDVDEGKAVIITYNKNEVPAKQYKATIEFRGDYSLTDKEIEDFMTLDSLSKRFSKVYKRRDFDLAVQGLQLFDIENGYGIFELPEWLSIVEELQKEWPESTNEETENVSSRLDSTINSLERTQETLNRQEEVEETVTTQSTARTETISDIRARLQNISNSTKEDDEELPF